MSKEESRWRNSEELGLYKDKPYQKPRRRKALLLFALLFTFLLIIVQFGGFLISDRSLLTGIKKKPRSWEAEKQAVKEAFEKSWAGYKKYAWGKDSYRPIAKRGSDFGPKPMGWIIVDSLDTMHIMGLNQQLKEAREWVENVLDYDMSYEVNTFETTIRMLGGLLSAFYLTSDSLYRDKAIDLGNRLLGAFNSPSGIPYSSVNLHSYKGIKSHSDGGASSTAEAATLQLEFKYLANLTSQAVYWEKAEKVNEVIEANHKEGGLVPIFINPDSGMFRGDLIRLGSRGDSYYEYLIKQYLQTKGEEPVYKDMYDEAVSGIKEHLVRQSYPGKLKFIGELEHGIGGALSTKMDHLVCFVGGMLAVGATNGTTIDKARKQSWTTVRESDFRLGLEITRTCYETYASTDTGLGPEIVVFNVDENSSEDFFIKNLDSFNMQRPELVESLFYLWRITRKEIYREWGWKIFQSFEKWTRLEGDGGYASLEDVRIIPPPLRDNMESFWLAETLKYFYLLFDDTEGDLLPLTDIVFNTEGHPLPRFSMGTRFTTGWRRTK